MAEYRAHCIINNVLKENRHKAQSCHAEDESAYGKTLVPGGIVQLKELGIGHLLIKNLAHHTKDIHCRDDDRRTCQNGSYTMERAGILKATHEDGHLGYET